MFTSEGGLGVGILPLSRPIRERFQRVLSESTFAAEREDEASEHSLASIQRAWVEVKTPQA